MKENPKAYEYDWAGACVPEPGAKPAYEDEGFSVGIFQWVPKLNGKGIKRGGVIKRIKGLVANPEEVFRRADQICKELNARWEREQKTAIAANNLDSGE